MQTNKMLKEQTFLGGISSVKNPALEEPALREMEVDESCCFGEDTRNTDEEGGTEGLHVAMNGTEIT